VTSADLKEEKRMVYIMYQHFLLGLPVVRSEFAFEKCPQYALLKTIEYINP